MIHQLSTEIIKKISAGEVITTPYSIVKEMIENSLDAESTRITIKLSRNMTNIEIIDDGFGISRNDLELLCERHCTSKISGLADLAHIKSFGFRGEALFSISSCSKLTARSFHNTEGYEGNYVDGKLIALKKIGMAKGTHIKVSDVFFNNLVRRKYIEQNTNERRKVDDLVKMYAVSNSEVIFNYEIDGISKIDMILHQKNNETALNKVAMLTHIYNFTSELRCVTGNCKKGESYILIHSQTTLHLRKSSFILFVNQRLVENRKIKQELLKVYTPVLPKNKFPFLYCELTIPSTRIDVNVHPAKKEVLFEEEFVVDEIKECLLKSLEGGDIHSIPCIRPNKDKEYSQKAKIKVYATPNFGSLKEFRNRTEVKNLRYEFAGMLAEEQVECDARFFKGLSLVGILENTLFVQQDQKLMQCNYTELLRIFYYQVLSTDAEITSIVVNIESSFLLNQELLRIFHFVADENRIVAIPSVFNVKLGSEKCLEIAKFISESPIPPAEFQISENIVWVRQVIGMLSQELAACDTPNVFECIKRKIICTQQVIELFSVVTTLGELYKQFERC